MQPRGCRNAVINKQARVHRTPRECRRMSWSDKGRVAATFRTGGGVKIDIVRKQVVRMIAEMRFDQITLADANESPGRVISKSPIGIGDAIGQRFHMLFYFDVEYDFGCGLAPRRRR